MGAVTAIAEQYKVLGFRVIEGGKSNKLVVIDSDHLAKRFGKEHKHVLDHIDDVVAEIKSHGRNVGHEISNDVRPTTYFVRGRPFRCYLLTETGFELIASGWDAVLRYELLLAFRQLREEFGRAHSRPVAERLHELRGDWTQGELFPAPTSVPSVKQRQQRQQRHQRLRLIDNPNDPPDAPIFGYVSGNDDQAPHYRRESWNEHSYGGVDYFVTVTYRQDVPWYIRIMLARMTNLRDRGAWHIPSVPQSLLTWEEGNTPKEIFVSVLNRIGFNSDLIKATLQHVFDFDD